jgi:hypothetical protein
LIVRGAVGVMGLGYVLASGIGVVATVVRLVMGAPAGNSLAALWLAIGLGTGGVSMVRWALPRAREPPGGTRRRLRGAPPAAEPVEQLLLAVAREHGGSVTAAEMAAALSIEPTHALRMLDEATQAGDARVLFSSEGIAVYEFPGLLASKTGAKEPWDL